MCIRFKQEPITGLNAFICFCFSSMQGKGNRTGTLEGPLCLETLSYTVDRRLACPVGRPPGCRAAGRGHGGRGDSRVKRAGMLVGGFK